MKRILYIFLFVLVNSALIAQSSLSLLGSLEYPGTNGNDIWGYYDSIQDREYALMGLRNGFSVVDVTDPATPAEMFFISDSLSTWRDIKTWDHYAYVIHDNGMGFSGLLIVDLDDMSGATYLHDTTFFKTAHNIYIDENGFAYIFGTNNHNGGCVILDLSIPDSPTQEGVFDQVYFHDGMVRGDTLWGSAVYEGEFYAVDVSDKSNPVVLAQHSTPDNFTHNCWISDDGKTLFTTDEKTKGYVASYDVSDFNNIEELDRWQSNPGSGVIPHNTHVLGNFLVTSYYKDGVVITDATFPENLVEVASYDSYGAGEGNGFEGNWGAYPYLPSGNLLISDMNSGTNGEGLLSILGTSYVAACYLEGIVTDAATSDPLPFVTVCFLNNPTQTTTDNFGEFATGMAASGTYSVVFKKAGYANDTVDIPLSSGSVTNVQIALVPDIPIDLNGVVMDAESGLALENAMISFQNLEFTFLDTTDSNGALFFDKFFKGIYTVEIGLWGYEAYCNEIDISADLDTIWLETGYADNFSFDLGWIGSGTAYQGDWVRDVPVETSYDVFIFNPGIDAPSDCGNQAFVTGNNNGDFFMDDIGGGFVRLESPEMDLSTFDEPFLSYDYWYINGTQGGPGTDTFRVSISNGVEEVSLQEMTGQEVEVPVIWREKMFRLSDFIQLTSTMKIVVYAEEYTTGYAATEAGFDHFMVKDSMMVGIQPIDVSELVMIYPNPTADYLNLEIKDELEANKVSLLNLQGRGLMEWEAEGGFNDRLDLSAISSGVYFLKIEGKETVIRKVIKK